MSSPSTCTDRRWAGWQRVLLVLGALMLCAGPARAQGVLERLVTPGKLSQAHAEYEGECKSCHSSFSKADQTRLCVTCHEEIAGDIKRHLGFHGRSSAMRTSGGKGLTPCKTCHTEHEGRRFDIARFDHKNFDHALTDFPLEGGHRTASCRDCHQTAKKFREAPHACVSCHGKNDPHKGELGNDCASCHLPEDWRDITFDHSRTRFALTGAHSRAQCAACHSGGRFEGVATECVSCHREDDKHHGRFGTDCKTCHTAKNWTDVRFDHNSQTDYPLIGQHRAAACESCHTGHLYKDKVEKRCISCHAKDDVHKGSAGPDCRSCHSPAGWTNASFDHNSGTRFPLKGAHAAVPCRQCHVQPPEQVKLPVTCIGCHTEDDAHNGQQGTACESCHSVSGWKMNVRFDHGLAAFPLIGAHARASCSACHHTAAFKDAPSDCFTCHRDDDWHKGTLGRDCETCHNPAGWKFWRFDHATQTDYPLTGAHDGLECAACHRQKTDGKIRQSTVCISCHRRDDVHKGGFGRNCERCHNTTSFGSGIRPSR